MKGNIKKKKRERNKTSSGQFGSAVLAMLWPQLLIQLLAGRAQGNWKILKISTTSQQVKHRCVINIALTRNPKHTVPATEKKINFVPAETRTVAKQ